MKRNYKTMHKVTGNWGETYHVKCCYCSKTMDTGETELEDALKIKKEDGWRTFRGCKEWLEKCPRCIKARYDYAHNHRCCPHVYPAEKEHCPKCKFETNSQKYEGKLFCYACGAERPENNQGTNQ